MTLIQQQRLLGAILLAGLISVIAWLLLDTVEQNQPAPPQEAPIVFDSVIEPILEEDELIEPVEEVLEQAEETTEPEADAQTVVEPPPVEKAKPQPETASAPEKTTAVDIHQTGEAAVETAQPKWVLQLASFSVRKNAEALSAQLTEMGYKPMIETTSSSTGKLIYRVRLQPVSDRSKLEQTAQTLNRALKLNTQILQYHP
jgi:cell division protein FtsN